MSSSGKEMFFEESNVHVLPFSLCTYIEFVHISWFSHAKIKTYTVTVIISDEKMTTMWCDAIFNLISLLSRLHWIREREKEYEIGPFRDSNFSLPLSEPRTVLLPTLVVRSTTSAIVNCSLPDSRKVREGIQFAILTLFSSLLHFVNEDLLNVMSWTRCSRLWTFFTNVYLLFQWKRTLTLLGVSLVRGAFRPSSKKNNEMFTSKFKLFSKKPLFIGETQSFCTLWT